MKLRLTNLPAPVTSAQPARSCARSNRAGRLSRLCAGLLLAVSVTGQVQEAGAAPKAKATPTPSPTPTATPSATPTPAPVPTVTPAATATPDPAATPTYNGTQQGQYIAIAREAFVALRSAKSQPFLEAHAALEAAGGMSSKGLKTKEDIAARRDLVAKTSAANDLYLEFIKTQQDTYRAELAKTPLIPGDVDALAKQFEEKANTPTTLKLRETERDVLKAGDDIMANLDKKFGAWTVNEAGKVTFKKASDVSAMNALGVKYNAKVATLQKLREELAPAAVASPSPAASPGVTPAVVPTSAPGAAPAASPAATVSAAPSAKAKS